MIRLIFVALFLFLFLLFGTPILLLSSLVKKKNPYAVDLFFLRAAQNAFRVILFISGVKLTVIGKENIPTEEAVLYVGNHRSYFDIVITYSLCPGLTGYIAKDSMRRIPLLSTWMRRLHCLFINRSDIKEALKTILAGIDQIKNGISVCIFPEGTRGCGTDETDMPPFKEGSLKMAEKTGCAIVPMALTGTADLFEKHIPWIRPARVIVQYGKPIYPKELAKEEQKRLGNYTQRIILHMLEQSKLPQVSENP